MTRRPLDKFSYGGRLPGSLGLLLTLLVATSLAIAFTSRHGGALLDYATLQPRLVLRGQLWRLVTWPFIEPSPLGLLIGCLMLWWFGRDLADEWGDRRFLFVWVGVSAAAGVATCVVGLVDSEVAAMTYVGVFALSEALVVAWGLCYPWRVVRLFFLLPIRGYWLAWLTIAITVVYAVYSGWEHFMPVLLADGMMLAWLYAPSVTSWWSSRRRRGRGKEQALARKRRDAIVQLRAIEQRDGDDASLPPEVEAQLKRLLGGPKDKER